MKEFMFDITLDATIRFTAANEAAARALMTETLVAVDGHLGQWPNGRPICCEATLRGTPVLLAIDGERVGVQSTSTDDESN